MVCIAICWDVLGWTSTEFPIKHWPDGEKTCPKVTGTYTIHPYPNTRERTPRLRYCIPKINTHSWAALPGSAAALYRPKCLADANSQSMLTALTTHWLPAQLRTRQKEKWLACTFKREKGDHPAASFLNKSPFTRSLLVSENLRRVLRLRRRTCN